MYRRAFELCKKYINFKLLLENMLKYGKFYINIFKTHIKFKIILLLRKVLIV